MHRGVVGCRIDKYTTHNSSTEPRNSMICKKTKEKSLIECFLLKNWDKQHKLAVKPSLWGLNRVSIWKQMMKGFFYFPVVYSAFEANDFALVEHVTLLSDSRIFYLSQQMELL